MAPVRHGQGSGDWALDRRSTGRRLRKMPEMIDAAREQRRDGSLGSVAALEIDAGEPGNAASEWKGGGKARQRLGLRRPELGSGLQQGKIDGSERLGTLASEMSDGSR